MAASTLLKLRARDAEDMAVISTCLQDALVPLCDVAYLKAKKRFVMVANRFKWETAKTAAELSPPGVAAPGSDARFEDDSGKPAFERVHCGVRFDRVRAVQVRGLDLRSRDHILNLLAIEAAPRRITLVFSGSSPCTAVTTRGRAVCCPVPVCQQLLSLYPGAKVRHPLLCCACSVQYYQ